MSYWDVPAERRRSSSWAAWQLRRAWQSDRARDAGEAIGLTVAVVLLLVEVAVIAAGLGAR